MQLEKSNPAFCCREKQGEKKTPDRLFFPSGSHAERKPLVPSKDIFRLQKQKDPEKMIRAPEASDPFLRRNG